MSRVFKQWCVIALFVLSCGVCLLWIFGTPYERYYKQFDATLLGLTKEQVVEKVGQPTSIIPDEDMWGYTIGRSPGTYLGFTDNKVVEISGWDGRTLRSK